MLHIQMLYLIVRIEICQIEHVEILDDMVFWESILVKE